MKKTLMILEQKLKILVIVYSEKRNRQLALKSPFNFDLVNLELPIVKEKSFFPEEKGELVDQEGHLQGF